MNMFKILFKKQMTELFKSYFINRKTGKLRPNNQIALFILMFIGILAMLSVSFSGLSKTLALNLVPDGYSTLYFELLGAVSIGFGVFGSVFSSYEMLYNAKDNDFLLSMPIKPSTLLGSRLMSSFLLSIIYEAVIYVPAVIEYCRYSGVNAANIVFPGLNLFISAFFVLALTCLFGWFMAAAASRMRNKNTFTILASLLAVGIYYFIMFRVNDLINNVIANPNVIEAKIRRFAVPLWLFGSGSQGNIIHFFLFILLTAVILIITVSLMSVSFIRLATANKGLKKKGFRFDSVRSGSKKSALLHKEAGRFFGTPILFLNAGIGLLIGPAVSVIALVKSSALTAALSSLPSKEIAAGLILSAVCFISSIGEITASSVSLEGKSLWILQSLPVKTEDILRSKIKLDFILSFVSSGISLLIMSAAFRINPVTAVLMLVAAALNILLVSCIGLMINLMKPDLSWTNEMIPVKQDPPVIYSMLAGMALSALPAGISAALMMIPSYIAVSVSAAVYICALIPVIKWLKNKGTELFSTLQ